MKYRIPFAVLWAAIVIVSLAGCDSKTPARAGAEQSPRPVASAPEFVFGDGFLKQERSVDTSFRWALQSASLSVKGVTAGHYRLVLKPITVFSTNENTIEVIVNGRPAGKVSTHSFDFANPVSAQPDVMFRDGDNEVTLKSDREAVPLGEKDERKAAFGLVLPVRAERVNP